MWRKLVASIVMIQVVFVAGAVIAGQSYAPYRPQFPADAMPQVFDAEVGLSWDIFWTDTQTNGVRVLTDHFASDRFPVLSPDAAYISFVSWRDGNSEVYILDINSGSLRNLSNDGATDLLQAWSPDGSMLAFVSERDGNAEIYVADLNRGFLNNVTRNPAHDTSPRWAADGSGIIFKSDRGGVWGEYSVW